MRSLHIVERVSAGNLDRRRAVNQSCEDVGGAAADCCGVGEMVGKAWPCQKERPGLPELDGVKVFDVSAEAECTRQVTPGLNLPRS